MKELEALYRSQGRSPRDARSGALVASAREDEIDKAARGLTYDEDRVRVAQVHARDDLVLLCAQGAESRRVADAQLAVLRQIRWLLVALVLLVVWRVV